MKVKFLVSTAYKGPRKEGEVISVPDDFAKRWAKNGIAKIVDDESDSENDKNQSVGSDDVSDTNKSDDLSKLSAKELYELCNEKGLEVEAKKSKNYYLDALAEAE